MNFCSSGRRYQPIYGCEFHFHENWELILQYSAHTVAMVGGQRFEMKAGDIIIIPPNVVHNTISDTLFTDMYIQLKKCDFPTWPILVSDKDGVITSLFEMTMDAYTEKDEGYELFVEKLSELICLYLKKAARDRNQPEVVNRFKLLLMDNIENTQFDLGCSIEETGYHPDYFRRLFKRCTGSSPLAYLMRLRMDHAKKLLCFEKYLSIEQVAYRCGFQDSFYFSARFKKEVGVSPYVFRKNSLER